MMDQLIDKVAVMTRTLLASILFGVVLTILLGRTVDANDQEQQQAEPQASEKEADSASSRIPIGHPTFMSPHAAPIVSHGSQVFVANTPADTVDVIDRHTKQIVARINVGIDPISVAVRPDGKEVWVSNHVSDSVSVIDTDPSQATYLHVIDTVQDFDLKTRATRFDEPVGIAFASNEKAYVALSSENQIAVIDVASRKISRRLNITAQDPRAIVVRGNRLYVIPFESNNKTQLSGGAGDKIDGDLVTFDAWNHSVANNNVLSIGHVLDIVKHPRVPDRDLYVFDTRTDELVEVVDTLGTLLYGLTVDSKGRVYIAQTDARNDANGRAGTKKHGLKELENRAFLNQITQVSFNTNDAESPRFIDLEPLPPQHPASGEALATPFAIQVSADDSTLVATAAGSDKLFTVDTDSGKILGRVDVESVPRGIALENTKSGKASQAWVLNAVSNTVSLVDVSDAANPKVVDTIVLQDPTHPEVKRGRIAFNTAAASTTETFSCASCHPDGHTDQLLWVLKTPIVTGGDQIMPRSTMPIRGLRDTAPYHWDGIPGDPYGGNNSANVHGSDPPNSNKDDPTSTTRHLIDGGLAATMALVGDETVNDEGKAGKLSASERGDMAKFLLSVPYPPAQKRSYDNVVSKRAEEGFELFHIKGHYDGKPAPNVCGNCHRMPFLVSTNTPGTGMDAPTWRGAYDRFLILPQGRLNIIDFDFYRRVADEGIPERKVWQFSWQGQRRFDPIWDMVLEGSTGYSGSFARQVTLNDASVNDEMINDLMDALEQSANEDAIVLDGDGVLIDGDSHNSLELQFDGGSYVSNDRSRAFTRTELLSLATRGKFVGSFTARHGINDDVDHPQPAIWTLSPLERQSGRQEFPILYAGHTSMMINGRHIDKDASVVVDGRRASSALRIDEDEKLEVTLSSLPDVGMHLLQLHNPGGQFSNDFIFYVANDAEAAAEQRRQADEEHRDVREALALAASRGDISEAKRLLRRAARRINERQPSSGSTALSSASLHGRLEMMKYLIERGADVDSTNRDGNTPLIVAAFMCRAEVVKLLLEKGATPSKKNNRGDSAIDVVSSPWTDELAVFYNWIGSTAGIEIDLERLENDRPKMAKLIQDHAASEKQGDDGANQPSE